MPKLSLSLFGCQLGAKISADADKIVFPGTDRGIVVYGPYHNVSTGPHIFIISISFPNIVQRPEVAIEVFSGSKTYCRRLITTHSNIIELQAYFDKPTAVEIRVESNWTAFEITGVSCDSTEDFFESEVDCRAQTHKALTALFRGGNDSRGQWDNIDKVKQALFGRNAILAVPFQALDQNEELLIKIGIKPAAIRALFTQPKRDRRIDPLEADPLNDGHPQVGNAFQESMLIDSAFTVLSPFTGSLVSTSDAVPIPLGTNLLPIVYEFFAEKEPFVVGVGGGWVGAVSFIWLVTRDIIISADPGESTWVNPETTIADYVVFCVRHAEELKLYRGKTHKVAIASGFVSNMGHYFWNDISGLERLIRFTGLKGVSSVYTCPHSWLQVEEIFASDNLPPVIKTDNWHDVGLACIRKGEMLLRPTGTSFDNPLGEKILEASIAVFRDLNINEYLDSCTQIESANFVLFCNLRAHNKAWREQREGVREVVKAVKRHLSGLCAQSDIDRKECGGKVIVFLDGYHDCAAAAQSIMEPPIDDVIFVDGTAKSFAVTLFWAFNCSAFMAVVGSGLVPLTWIADKPGVCYSERQHLGQLKWWQSVRKTQNMLLFPDVNHVFDDVDSMYANYSIDPHVIVGLFEKLLASMKISR